MCLSHPVICLATRLQGLRWGDRRLSVSSPAEHSRGTRQEMATGTRRQLGRRVEPPTRTALLRTEPGRSPSRWSSPRPGPRALAALQGEEIHPFFGRKQVDLLPRHTQLRNTGTNEHMQRHRQTRLLKRKRERGGNLTACPCGSPQATWAPGTRLAVSAALGKGARGAAPSPGAVPQGENERARNAVTLNRWVH